MDYPDDDDEAALPPADEAALTPIAPGEPIFVLRATDKLAPRLVRQWARLAASHGCGAAKVAEAEACAEAMERWPHRAYPA
jgi:hypothetical protein